MAGYSGTPLVKKLGYKPGMKIKTIGEPAEYRNWIAPLPENVQIANRNLDLIHLFVKEQKKFKKELLRLKTILQPAGMIWISWPKKTSGIRSDLDENLIREFALKNDLVDVKVCAVNETWSGLKLVIPLKKRTVTP